MRFHPIDITRRTTAEEVEAALARSGIEAASDRHGGYIYRVTFSRRQRKSDAPKLLPRIDLGGPRHAP